MIRSSLNLPIDLLSRIKPIISSDLQAYLVGGAIRDSFLGRTSYDLDFALSSRASDTARRVANLLQAAYYPLDISRDIGRVIIFQPDGGRWNLDFAAFQGSNLESDLHQRDFTINAMALSLRDLETLVDPLGGIKDLKDKLLRACSSTSFLDDPIRIPRAFRQAVDFKLSITPETKKWIRQAVPKLSYTSKDRLRDEIFRILEGSHPVAVFRNLEIVGAFEIIFPELMGLKNIPAQPPHISDAFSHSLDTVQRLLQILQVLSPVYESELNTNWALGLISGRLGRYRQLISEHLKHTRVPGRPVSSLLLLAALYHDVGKPSARSGDIKSDLHFRNHENLGAQIVLQRTMDLRLSRWEAERISHIVKNHMRPLFLVQSSQIPIRRSVYRFFRSTGEAGIEVCLLSMADTLATYGSSLPQEIWIHQLEVIRSLLEAWWERNEELISPIGLINGDELMEELKIKPSPLIGQILTALKEMQASGEIKSRSQAIDFAREYLDKTTILGNDQLEV